MRAVRCQQTHPREEGVGDVMCPPGPHRRRRDPAPFGRHAAASWPTINTSSCRTVQPRTPDFRAAPANTTQSARMIWLGRAGVAVGWSGL